jgi:DNA-binding response OmpR family regulator
MEESYKLVVICTRPQQLNTLKGFLARRKWTVSVHSSAKAGFDAIREVQPDWVLVSTSLPGVNPSKIASLLSQLSKATMILFTEGTDNKSVGALFSHSAFQIIPPPISGPKILVQVQKIVRANEERIQAATVREHAPTEHAAKPESDTVTVRDGGTSQREKHNQDIFMMRGKRQTNENVTHSHAESADENKNLEEELARELEDLEREVNGEQSDTAGTHSEHTVAENDSANYHSSSGSKTRSQVIIQESVAKNQRSGVIIQEGLKSKQSAGSVTQEGPESNQNQGMIIEQGLHTKQTQGSVVEEGTKSKPKSGVVFQEGLKSKQSGGVIIQESTEKSAGSESTQGTFSKNAESASIREQSPVGPGGKKLPIKKGTEMEFAKGDDFLSKQILNVFQKVCPETDETPEKEVIWARRLGVVPVKSASHQGMLILALDEVGMAPTSFLREIVKVTREGLDMKTTAADADLEFFISVDAFDFPDWAKKQGEFFITSVFRSARIGATFVSDASLFDRVFVEKKGERFAFPIANLFPSESLDFDIYVYLPTNQKFVKYIHAGQRVGEDQIAGLAKKNVAEFFIDSREVYSYRQYYIGGLVKEFISGLLVKKKTAKNAA